MINKNSDRAGFTLIELIIVCLIGYGIWWLITSMGGWREEWKKQAEERQEESTRPDRGTAPGVSQVREPKQQEDLGKELTEFAKENVPELQTLIGEIFASIADRNRRIEELRSVLIRLGDDPEKDEDLNRWKRAVETLSEDVESLLVERKNAYRAFKKFEIGRVENKSEEERAAHVSQVMEKVRETGRRYKKVLLELESGERSSDDDSEIPVD